MMTLLLNNVEIKTLQIARAAQIDAAGACIHQAIFRSGK